MKKRLFATLMILCLLIGLLPTTVLAADAEHVSSFDELKSAIETASTDENTYTSIIVDEDFAFTETLNVEGKFISLSGSDNKTVTLTPGDDVTTMISANNSGITIENLTFNGNNNQAKIYGGSNSTLELKNKAILTYGKCTTNYKSTIIMRDGSEISHHTGNQGGAINLWEQGTFIMYGGSLTDNVAGYNGGAVDVNASATMTMYDGLIARNHNSGNNGGGAVSVRSSSTFKMYGGEISNNKATFGDAIYNNSSVVEIYGGKICNNTTNVELSSSSILSGMSINLLAGGTIQNNTGAVAVAKLEGDPVVSGNYDKNNQAVGIVGFAPTNNTRNSIVIAGALTGNASVEVSRTTIQPASGETFSSGENHTITDGDLSKLKSLDDGYMLYRDGSSLKWALKRTVTFDGNGGTTTGSATTHTQTVPGGIETTLNADTFANGEYVFKGWNTAADGTGTTYADSQSVTLNEDLTLYAQWISEITLDVNGGTSLEEAASQIEVSKNKAISTASDGYTLPTPTRDGFTFAGWNTKADGTGEVVTAETVPTGNTTIYAQWTMELTSTDPSTSGSDSSSTPSYTVNAILDRTYTGEAIEPAVVVKNGSDTLDSTAYRVEYKDNIDAGKATATVTIDGYTATVPFTIVQDQNPTVTMDAVSVTYGAAYTMTATAKTAAGNTINGEITIQYYTNEACTQGETATAPTAAGTYYAKATLKETANYAKAETTVKIDILAATFTVAATGYTGVYDGAAHRITVSSPADAVVTYSTDGETYGSENPAFTDVGTYTVYYKVTRANYQDVTGSATVTITRGSTISTASNSTTATLPTETATVADTAAESTVVSVTTTTDEATGTVTETTEMSDGATTVVETQTDGTVTTIDTAANGVQAVTVAEPGKQVTASIAVPENVTETTVTIPAEVGSGVVAVDADTGEIIMLSVATEDGLVVKLDGSANIILVDNSTDYADVADDNWAADAVAFATAHTLFNGTSETTFDPDGDMTRAMLVTVLARFDGVDTDTGDTWYEAGMNWAVEQGITDGTDPAVGITREQLVTMLYRYVGSPAVSGSLSDYSDADSVSSYAADAMAWAVENGILNGINGSLAPQATATRAQVAAIFQRLCTLLVS
jgi:uncharacterized repeat protein (TIGR02543 family)